MRLAVLLALAGCQATADSAKSPGNARPHEPTISTAASRICDAIVQCEEETGRAVVSTEACVDVFMQAAGCDDYHVSADAMAACETRLDDAGCDAVLLAEAIVSRECTEAVEVAELVALEGEPCQNFDVACASGTYCRFADPGTCRTCVALPLDGEACTEDSLCAAGHWCDDTETCAVLAADDTPCEDDVECASGHCVMEACGTPLDAQSSCALDADCDSGWCDLGLCQALRPDDDACGGDVECASGWCDGSCRQPVARGEICTFGDRCAGVYRYCRAGLCADRAGLGDPCSFDTDCAERGICDDGHCAESLTCVPAELGELCDGRCVADAYCELDEEPARCLEGTALGEACSADDVCGEDAFCDPLAEPEAACAEQRAVGQPCDGDHACASTARGIGQCDYSADPEPVCMLRFFQGEPCSGDAECITGYCDPDGDVCADVLTCEMP